MQSINSGDHAWVMISGCLVMFMTPGICFFYGGMVNKKNMLSTITYCMLVFCVSSLTWAMLGFSLVYGNPTAASGYIGDCTYCGLRNILSSVTDQYSQNVPLTTFFFFQMMLASVCPAIFIGSLVGRIRIPFLIPLIIFFQLIVYCPIAYWFWNTNGWLKILGSIDFAGGSIIHIPAGFAALASAVFFGSTKIKALKQNSKSVSLSLIGTSILWFGWFGFNGGSALVANLSASVALVNTHLAACAGGLGWAAVQYLMTDKLSIIGWCCGSICGLVGITPCAGFVALWSSIVVGAISGIISYVFCHFKSQHFDELSDTLDVFGCHGVSAVWGGIAAGAFATGDSGNSVNGLFYGGGGHQFGVNVLGVVVCAGYSFVVTLTICFLLSQLTVAKVTDKQQEQGLDKAIHHQQNERLTIPQVINVIKSLERINGNNKEIMDNLQQMFLRRNKKEMKQEDRLQTEKNLVNQDLRRERANYRKAITESIQQRLESNRKDGI